MELPWSIRTLDTIKLAITIGMTMGVILLDGVDAFEISVGEHYRRKASRVRLLAFVGDGVHTFVGAASASLSSIWSLLLSTSLLL